MLILKDVKVGDIIECYSYSEIDELPVKLDLAYTTIITQVSQNVIILQIIYEHNPYYICNIGDTFVALPNHWLYENLSKG